MKCLYFSDYPPSGTIHAPVDHMNTVYSVHETLVLESRVTSGDIYIVHKSPKVYTAVLHT